MNELERSELIRITHRWIRVAAETRDAYGATEGLLRDVERYDAEHRPSMSDAGRTNIGRAVSRWKRAKKATEQRRHEAI